jgi:pilus assembly protein Flp/PilA
VVFNNQGKRMVPFLFQRENIMKATRNILSRLRRDEEGATAIEYGLLAALIAVMLIGGASFLGGQLDQTFQGVGNQLQAQQPVGGTGGGTPTTP